ncbi:hypothetical protein VNI00_015453 [Paramarasmius palmivorus]|uniref:Uncharacterized protein n=1 Tax=Paramarasmius palmivorus TaxID=297713 RepID=A0AAW0BK01_9AGAR
MVALDIVGRQASTTTSTFSSSTSVTESGVSSAPPSSSVASSTTSQPPFFPSGSPMPPTPEQQEQESRSDTARSILEFLFLACAFLLILSFVSRRILRLRQQGVPVSQFFRRSRQNRRRSMTEGNGERQRFPRTTGLPVHALSASTLPYHLAELPAAYTPDGGDRYAPHLFEPRRVGRLRTTAAGIDSRGRRVDGGERDWDGDDDGELPPYDKNGGPPVYVDVLGVRAMQRVRQSQSEEAVELQPTRREAIRDADASAPPAESAASAVAPTQPPRYSQSGEITRNREAS